MPAFAHQLVLSKPCFDDGAAERVAMLEAEIERLRADKVALEAIARVDALTGIGNRRAFEEVLERSLRLSARYGNAVSVLLFDLDGMKQLNDRYGHGSGDDGLRAVAAVLRETLRASDVACRCGGDEFAVVLPGTGAEGAMCVAEKIRAAIEAHLLPVGRGMIRPFTASIGVSTFDGSATFSPERMEQLVESADAALYRVKQTGKNGVKHADEIGAMTTTSNVVAMPPRQAPGKTAVQRRQRQSRPLRAVRF